MSRNYWIGGSGAQNWTNTANWSLGAAPVSTNDVFILQGNSDIQTNLAASAVTLASLTIADSFSGTISSDATTQTASPLAIGCSGNVIINCQSQRIWLDFGSTTPTIVVIQTGSAPSTNVGGEALQIRGGGAGTTLSVTGSNSSVGVCTTVPGLTSTFTSWSIEDGSLTVGSGCTWTNGMQSGNGSNSGGTVTTYGAGTLIQQSGSGILNTFGVGKITTINITGNAVLNHRPASGVAWDTLNIGPGAIVDCSKDPRLFTITNPITMAKQASWTTFNPKQCQVAGGGAYTINTQQCAPSDVSLNTGGPAIVTIYA